MLGYPGFEVLFRLGNNNTGADSAWLSVGGLGLAILVDRGIADEAFEGLRPGG